MFRKLLSSAIGAASLLALPVHAQEVGDAAPVAVHADASPAPVTARAERGLYDDEGQGTDLYCRRKLGTWFYCDKPKTKPNSAQPSQPTQSADAQLKAIGKQLDELKARAILEPSEANVLAYVRFQREQLDRSSTFADVWQRALWQNPDVDYTLQRPVSTIGKRAWIDNRSAARAATMARLAQRYGVFYFYAQSCARARSRAPF